MKAKQSDLSSGVTHPDDLSMQKIEDLKERPTGTNQSRRIGMFQKSSDFDQFSEENPFTKMASNPCGDRCTGGS